MTLGWVLEHALTSAIGWLVGTALAYVWAKRRLLPHWRRVERQQSKIADQLDPSTPGGVTEILDRLERIEDRLPPF